MRMCLDGYYGELLVAVTRFLCVICQRNIYKSMCGENVYVQERSDRCQGSPSLWKSLKVCEKSEVISE